MAESFAAESLKNRTLAKCSTEKMVLLSMVLSKFVCAWREGADEEFQSAFIRLRKATPGHVRAVPRTVPRHRLWCGDIRG